MPDSPDPPRPTAQPVTECEFDPDHTYSACRTPEWHAQPPPPHAPSSHGNEFWSSDCKEPECLAFRRQHEPAGDYTAGDAERGVDAYAESLTQHAPSGEPDLEAILARAIKLGLFPGEAMSIRAALAQRDQAIAELRGELAGCVTVAEEIERRHAAVAQLAATLTLARQQRDEYLRELKLTRPVAEAGRGLLACLRGSAHRKDLAPIVEVCRVLLTTSQVTDLTAALQALDAASRARGESKS